MDRHRHIRVDRLTTALKPLLADDIICIGELVTGNPAVVRDRQQIGWIDTDPADVGEEWPEGDGSLELFDAE